MVSIGYLKNAGMLELTPRIWFTAVADTISSSTGQTGESMTSRVVYIGLDGAQVGFLEQSYAELKQSVYDGLVMQTRLADFGEAANDERYRRVA